MLFQFTMKGRRCQKVNITTQEISAAILDAVIGAVQELFGFTPSGLRMDLPPESNFGHFTVAIFPIARSVKKPIAQVAAEVAKTAKEKLPFVKKIEAKGAYLNFRIENDFLFGNVIGQALAESDDFGSIKTGRTSREKTMVEYVSPNTNKPLHVGHVRNGVLGMAVSSILQAAGRKVIKANLVNDRGVHICKSMLAWQKWGNGATPKSAGIKGDHFVGRWYVRYAQELEKDPGLEQDVQTMLQKWEQGDPEIIKLWKMMNGWVYEGFDATYKEYGFSFDALYYESNTYKLGKDLVSKGIKQGVFYRNAEGAIVADLPVDQFGAEANGKPKKVTLLRENGTSVYITQDLGTAERKFSDFGLDSSIYVVGSEQEYHFKCLFTLLGMLGFAWADKCYHLSYGMVYLPKGKMKSREGKVVDADDLLKDVEGMVIEEIKKRNDGLAIKEVAKRAKVIALAAIKFFLLQINPRKDIHFDPRKSISFEGYTGPYCQYAYARACSIIKGAGNDWRYEDADFSLLGGPEETELIKKIFQFPAMLAKAAEELNPSVLVEQVYQTASAFNQFYHACPVLSAETDNLKKARLALVKSAAVVIKRGLNLLGIDVLENM